MMPERGRDQQEAVLMKEIMLQVNQRLFESDAITKEVYERAKAMILNNT